MKSNKLGTMVLALMLVCSLATSAFAAPKYAVDLNGITGEKEVQARVQLNFILNGEKTVVKGDNNLGYPYLLNINGISGGITWVPIRLISEALGAKIDWVEATKDEAAHAIIYTPKDGTVKLFLNATTVTSSGGKTYSEPSYKFPDGTSIPLCLTKTVDSKGGSRIYVPLRFIVTYLLPDAKITWSNAGGFQVTISSDVEEIVINGVREGLGFAHNTDLLLEMPNTREAVNKHGVTPSSDSGTTLIIGQIIVRAGGSEIIIEGLSGLKASVSETFDIAEAVIKDVCDAESATAINEWLDGLRSLWNVEEVDRNAIDKWFLANADKDLTMGNVTVFFDGENHSLTLRDSQ